MLLPLLLACLGPPAFTQSLPVSAQGKKEKGEKGGVRKLGEEQGDKEGRMRDGEEGEVRNKTGEIRKEG